MSATSKPIPKTVLPAENNILSWRPASPDPPLPHARRKRRPDRSGRLFSVSLSENIRTVGENGYSREDSTFLSS